MEKGNKEDKKLEENKSKILKVMQDLILNEDHIESTVNEIKSGTGIGLRDTERALAKLEGKEVVVLKRGASRLYLLSDVYKAYEEYRKK